MHLMKLLISFILNTRNVLRIHRSFVVKYFMSLNAKHFTMPVRHDADTEGIIWNSKSLFSVSFLCKSMDFKLLEKLQRS